MPPLPQRVSLVDQVVAILREGITEGRWCDELPSERAMCRDLQVSRVTLRKAITQLTRERWLASGGRGCQHRIRRKPTSPAKAVGRTIRVLSPVTPVDLGSVQSAALQTLVERVTANGYRVEYEYRPQLYQRHEPASLQRLEALPDTAGWILIYSTESMQSWFAESGWQCVVLGPLCDGVALSCVYPDMGAFARHVVARLHARGRRELVFSLFEDASLGSKRAAVTFLEEAERLGIHARVVETASGPQPLREAVGRLLAERPQPDAFVVVDAGDAVTILCCLLAARLRVPADAAVISGWDDAILDKTTPPVTRYRIDGFKLGRQLAKLVLDLIEHGPGKLRSVPIVPEFVAGGTLTTR
jgi:DNA-binding LacI/PurR family transcriptional regulator